jgi:hypothetical protein
VLKFGKAQTETGMAITLMKLEGEKTLPLKWLKVAKITYLIHTEPVPHIS